MKTYSRQQFAEESEISYNPMKAFKEPFETEALEMLSRTLNTVFLDILAMCTYGLLVCSFNDLATGLI